MLYEYCSKFALQPYKYPANDGRAMFARTSGRIRGRYSGVIRGVIGIYHYSGEIRVVFGRYSGCPKFGLDSESKFVRSLPHIRPNVGAYIGWPIMGGGGRRTSDVIRNFRRSHQLCTCTYRIFTEYSTNHGRNSYDVGTVFGRHVTAIFRPNFAQNSEWQHGGVIPSEYIPNVGRHSDIYGPNFGPQRAE